LSTTSAINGKEIFDCSRRHCRHRGAVRAGHRLECRRITEIGEYLRAGGGKRIRPALLLLSAKLFGYKGTGAVKLASVVEIIHTPRWFTTTYR